MASHGDSADVEVQLVGNQVGEVVQDSLAVDASNVDGGVEEDFVAHLPFCVEDSIAETRLQARCHRTVAHVDFNVLVVVDVAEDVVARNRMATVAENVHLDGFLGQHTGLFLVEIGSDFQQSASGLDGVRLLLVALDEGHELLPAFFARVFALQMSQIVVAEDDGLFAKREEKVFVFLDFVAVAEFVDDRRSQFKTVLFEPFLQRFLAFFLDFAVGTAQTRLNFSLRLRRRDEIEPFGLHVLRLRRKNLDLVAALQTMAERNEFVVDLRADAMRTEERMDLEGEIERGTVCGHRFEFAFRRENEDFAGEKVQFDGVEEVHRVGLRVVENFLDGANPVVEFGFVLVFLAVFAGLVFPMGGKALFGDVVHAVGTNLDFNPTTLLRHQRNVKCLIAIGFRMVDPIAKPVGMRLVDLADGDINPETFVHLVFARVGRENDAHGENVIDLVEGDVLVLHLAPDGVGRFHASLDFVADAHAVEFAADGFGEVLEEFRALFLREREFAADVFVFLGMLEAETQVFEFRLDFVEAESIGEWRVDVKRFACDFVLLVGWLRLERAHIVESVADFDEDDADVVAHRQQQFFEVLGLCRSLFAEDSTADFRQSIDDLGDFRAENILDVLDGVVGVLDHVVKQCRADARRTKSHFLAGNLRHGDGMHDVRLARESSDSLVGLTREVEGRRDDFGLFSVVRRQIGVEQSLKRAVNKNFFLHNHSFLFFLSSSLLGRRFFCRCFLGRCFSCSAFLGDGFLAFCASCGRLFGGSLAARTLVNNDFSSPSTAFLATVSLSLRRVGRFRVIDFDFDALRQQFVGTMGVNRVFHIDELRHVVHRQTQNRRAIVAIDDATAILRIQLFDEFDIDAENAGNLLEMHVAVEHERVGFRRQAAQHRADVVLAIIIHNVVGGDERRHVAARFGRQIGIDVPVVLHASGAVDSLVHVLRTAVVGRDDEVPVAENLVERFQITCSRIRRLDWVAPLIDERGDFEAVLLGGGNHELPQTRRSDARNGIGLQCRLDDGQIAQFKRQTVGFQRLLENRHIKVLLTEHDADRAAQPTAVSVDELPHDVVVGHFDDRRQLLESLDIDFAVVFGVVVGQVAGAIDLQIRLSVVEVEQAIDGERQGFGHVDDDFLFLAVLVLPDDNDFLEVGKVVVDVDGVVEGNFILVVVVLVYNLCLQRQRTQQQHRNQQLVKSFRYHFFISFFVYNRLKINLLHFFRK